MHDRWHPRKLILPLTTLAIFTLALSPLTDPDMFWHLPNGRLIWQTHAIPRHDPFSFTMSGKEWICHEWLTDLIMFALYNVGETALIIWGAALVGAAFALTMARCRSSPYTAAFATLLAALASMPSCGARPQMVNLLLSSLTLTIMEGNWPLWLLPLLTALWANMHAGFPTGVAIVGAHVLGESIEAAGNTEEERRERKRRLVHLILTAAAMIMASLINPYGPRLLLYPLQTLTSRAMREHIVEWFSPNFHEIAFQPLALLLLALIAALALSRRRPHATQIVLLLSTTYAALQSARHVPFLSIVAAPILARQIAECHRQWQTGRPVGRLARPCPPRLGRAISLIILLLAAAGCLMRICIVSQGNHTAQMERFPVQALSFMREKGLQGPLFNTYAWGGYLIWEGEKVFIDGRADLYGDRFLNLYVDLIRGKIAPYSTFDRHDIRRVLVKSDSPLATILRLDPGWEGVYQDDLASIFVRLQSERRKTCSL